ncbi:hypothetical protein [Anatilimnocola floriformis]|uniref:hypothetical protein n=1 Tax=Anatilimnocola floriformis TaxID=2948575 RepID=UPI0020C48926|nr:hypothetical protein [Anatilimnocola floriformis]
MRTLRCISQVASGLLLAAAIAVSTADAQEQVNVPKIQSVKFDLKAGTMEVTGEVPTGGYKDPQIIRVEYIKQPDDGIQDFNFVATKPDGIVTQVISKVSAKYDWKGEIPAWIKGVRIHGSGDGVKVMKIER